MMPLLMMGEPSSAPCVGKLQTVFSGGRGLSVVTPARAALPRKLAQFWGGRATGAGCGVGWMMSDLPQDWQVVAAGGLGALQCGQGWVLCAACRLRRSSSMARAEG